MGWGGAWCPAASSKRRNLKGKGQTTCMRTTGAAAVAAEVEEVGRVVDRRSHPVGSGRFFCMQRSSGVMIICRIIGWQGHPMPGPRQAGCSTFCRDTAAGVDRPMMLLPVLCRRQSWYAAPLGFGRRASRASPSIVGPERRSRPARASKGGWTGPDEVYVCGVTSVSASRRWRTV